MFIPTYYHLFCFSHFQINSPIFVSYILKISKRNSSHQIIIILITPSFYTCTPHLSSRPVYKRISDLNVLVFGSLNKFAFRLHFADSCNYHLPYFSPPELVRSAPDVVDVTLLNTVELTSVYPEI